MKCAFSDRFHILLLLLFKNCSYHIEQIFVRKSLVKREKKLLIETSEKLGYLIESTLN